MSASEPTPKEAPRMHAAANESIHAVFLTGCNLEAENARLRADLIKYGRHTCCATVLVASEPCDCGWDKVEADLAGKGRVSDKAIPLPVKSVRRLHPDKCAWRCDVTFGSPTSGHDDPTLTVTSEQLDTEPKPGDVLMVVPPRVVGFYENQPELTA